MSLINAENTQFYYFAHLDMLIVENDLPLEASMPDALALKYLPTANDVRLTLFQSMLYPKRGHFYFLFWRNTPNLVELDEKVLSGTYTDDDFASAVKTIFQETQCDNCSRVWPTLVIPPGDPYIEAPGLFERKIKESKFLPCPSCNAMFRQMVVKIFHGVD